MHRVGLKMQVWLCRGSKWVIPCIYYRYSFLSPYLVPSANNTTFFYHHSFVNHVNQVGELLHSLDVSQQIHLAPLGLFLSSPRQLQGADSTKGLPARGLVQWSSSARSPPFGRSFTLS